MITKYNTYIKESVDYDKMYLITISASSELCKISNIHLYQYDKLTERFKYKIVKMLSYSNIGLMTNKNRYTLQLEILLKTLLNKDKYKVENTNETGRKLLIYITTQYDYLEELIDNLNVNTFDQEYVDYICEAIITNLVVKNTDYLKMLYYKEDGDDLLLCSDKIYNKYQHYFNAKNFDLL